MKNKRGKSSTVSKHSNTCALWRSMLMSVAANVAAKRREKKREAQRSKEKRNTQINLEAHAPIEKANEAEDAEARGARLQDACLGPRRSIDH